MKRKASVLMLMIVLLFSIGSISFVDFAEANPPGPYDPTPTPPPIAHCYIKSDFTLTSNLLNCTLEVQSDNVVIDGAGFTLQGNWHTYDGITLDGRHNVTIKNVKIQNFGRGIVILGESTDNFICGNTLMDMIKIKDSFATEITNNTFNNAFIAITSSGNNVILNNHFIDCGIGLIQSSTKDIISNNNFDNGGIHLSSVTYYNVSNNSFSDNSGTPGIVASFSENNSFSQNIFINVEEAIKIQKGIANIITNNVISNGNSGINIYDGSYGNIIADNRITGESDFGLMICGSIGNNITRNFLYNNTVGFYIANTQIIWLSQFVNKSLTENTFNQNDVVNNNLSVRTQWSSSVPMPTDLHTEFHKMPISLYGNYWSDYDGTDSEGDGIGDTPYYTTDPSYVDSYPLMAPTYIPQRNHTDTQHTDYRRITKPGTTEYTKFRNNTY